MAASRLCSIPDCGKRHYSLGYCEMHYQAFRKHGDPLGGKRQTTKPGARTEWVMEHLHSERDECLIWPFSRTETGYGVIKWRGRQTRVTRVICTLLYGEPPTDKHEAAHTCGKGHLGCANGRHLYWATRKENLEDARAHGTWSHGSKVNFAKLTEDQVREIRQLGGHFLQREIAEKYGVCAGAIGLILRRKNWGWLE